MSAKLYLCILGAVGSITAFQVLPSGAQGLQEKVQVCTRCHGVDGKPIDKTIPNIWGQQTGYLYIQLRDFKRGDRKSEVMQPIASSFERDDMLAIAKFFAKKPWPD